VRAVPGTLDALPNWLQLVLVQQATFSLSARATDAPDSQSKACLAFEKLGWVMGIEPTTSGATVRCSAS
jgi:hypothetical protein